MRRTGYLIPQKIIIACFYIAKSHFSTENIHFHLILTLKSHKIACYLSVSASTAPPVDLLLTGVPVCTLSVQSYTLLYTSDPPSLNIYNLLHWKRLYFNVKVNKFDKSTNNKLSFGSNEGFIQFHTWLVFSFIEYQIL